MQSENNPATSISAKAVTGLIFLVFLAAFLIVMALNPSFVRDGFAFLRSLRGNPWAPGIFITVHTALITLAFPGFPMTLLAGPLFGLWPGALYAIIASNIGCQATFFISRWLGRESVTRRIKPNSRLERIQKAMAEKGFQIILFLRLVPIIPFSVTNYLAGLTPMSFKDYAKATFWGMLPGTIIYVYLSTTVTDFGHNPLAIFVAIGLLLIYATGIWVVKKKNLLPDNK